MKKNNGQKTWGRKAKTLSLSKEQLHSVVQRSVESIKKASEPKPRRRHIRALLGAKSFVALVVSVLSLGATALAYYCAAPKFTTAEPIPLDPSDPMSFAVTIKNDGYLSANDVNFWTMVVGARTEMQMIAIGNMNHSSHLDALKSNHSETVAFPPFSRDRIVGAEIAIIAEYSYPLLPSFRTKMAFFYQSFRTIDDRIVWLQHPAPTYVYAMFERNQRAFHERMSGRNK